MKAFKKSWPSLFLGLALFVRCSAEAPDGVTGELCTEPFRSAYVELVPKVTAFQSREAQGEAGTYYEALLRYHEAKDLHTQSQTVRRHTYSLYNSCRVSASSAPIEPYSSTYSWVDYFYNYIQDFERKY